MRATEPRPLPLRLAAALALGAALWLSSAPPRGRAQSAQPPFEVYGAPDAVDDPEGVEARAVAFVDGARRSLHAALYELGLPSVALALRQAADRGVEVRLFLESDNQRSPRERECLSVLAGVVEIRTDGRPTLMHDKFMVADGARVWTGSANLTWTGCHLHYNEALSLTSPALAACFEDQFERLCRGEADAPATYGVRVGAVDVDCAFAPAGDRLAPFLQAVRNARATIRVAAFSLTHPALVRALCERAGEGLEVDVVLDARLARGPAGRRAMEALRRAGCRLRTGGPRPSFELLRRFGLPRGQDVKIHHKLLVADDRRVVTGSANLSANGFEHNDENVLAFDAPPALARVYETILARAAAASADLDGSSEDDGDEPENPAPHD